MNIIFLRKFTKELILNSKKEKSEKKLEYSPQILSIENQIPNIESIMYSEIKKLNKNEDSIEKLNKPIIRKRIILQKIPTVSQKTPMISSIMHQMTQKTPQVSEKQIVPKKVPKEIQSQGIIRPVRIESQKIQPPTFHEEMHMPISASESLEIDLGKLNYIIKDIKVIRIECKGPGKKIIVMKMGQINLTETVLSEEEITEIIKIFSEKTRIPLVGGTFKAAYKNMLITAIISDYAGSRFIIEKRSPYSLIQSQNYSRQN